MANRLFRVLAGLALFALVSTGGVIGSTAVAPVEDEQWPSQFAATPGLHAIEIDEVNGLRDNVSVLKTIPDANGGTRLCTSATAAPCSTASGYDFRAVLGPCSGSVTVNCIESVTAITQSGEVSGVHSRQFPAQGVNEFTGDPSQGVPSGKAPQIYTFANVNHSNGNEYAVTVTSSGVIYKDGRVSVAPSLFASITPINIFQTDCNPAYNGVCMDTYSELGGQVRFAGVAADYGRYRCTIWGESSQCALKRAFPANVQWRLVVRLATAPAGWLHGRLADPSASITTANGVSTISVTAAPTKVPIVSGTGLWSSLPAGIQQWFTDNCPTICGTRLPGSLQLAPSQRNAVTLPTAYKESSFTQLDLWRDYIGDKAAAVPSQWSVRTLSEEEMNEAPACIKNATGVTGIVATNSTLYSEGPPTYDELSGTLNYKVSAPHFQPDGTTDFVGRYDLVLRSDIAECLYGIGNGDITSSVGVFSETDTIKPATTTMTSADGWFEFSATGFSFSTPTIKSRLDQEFGGFVTLRPSRILDTRLGVGGVPAQRVGNGVDDGGTELSFNVLGRGGLPTSASSIGAVSLNLTVANTTAGAVGGYVQVFPCGSTPTTSSVNFSNGQIVPNAVVTPVSSNGTVCFDVYGAADLIVDVTGYFQPIAGFNALTPARIMDTRFGTGDIPVGQVGNGVNEAGAELRFNVLGRGGLPTSASSIAAVSFNLTAANTSVGNEGGYVRAYPCGTNPTTSSVNFASGAIRPNAVISPVSSDGDICFRVYGRADLIVDVNGYVSTGAGFRLLPPTRVMDTRDGTGLSAAGKVGNGRNADGTVLQFSVLGKGGVPSTAADVGAVSMNLTAANTSVGPEGGYVQAYPCGATPVTSSINFVSGEIAPNAVIVPVSSDGRICFKVYGRADLVVDVNGYFTNR